MCEKYWEKTFPNYNFVWDKIWLSMTVCTKEAKLISLNWKIINNIYPTRALLCKMGKEVSEKCKKCAVIDDTIHFFFDCLKIKPIWCKAENLISERLNKKFKLTVDNVIFNYNCDIYDKNSKYINYIITVGKLCISKFIYGDHPHLLFLFEHELRLRGLLKKC